MKGDFSRDTYRPESRFSRVMMQQGRVQLDSDWNEQNSILIGTLRALTRDLFGPFAGPAAECGFRIVTAENRTGLPKGAEAEVQEALKPGKDFGDDMLILAGRYYVGGMPIALDRAIRLQAQEGYPFGDETVSSLGQHNWLAYLDVWEDYVSADQDPYLREAALNGVDTCGRARIRWRVRLMVDPKDHDSATALTATGSGRLRARANPGEDKDDLCSIAPDARYRGAENQLYRVEIHAGGAAGAKGSGASFKWSRDNGSTCFPILIGTGNQMTLAHLGRDELTTLVEQDWVELVDDALIAADGAGPLARVAKVDRDRMRVDLLLPDGAPALASYTDAEAAARHALLRRWDHKGDWTKSGGAVPISEGASNEMELEDGVKIVFEAGGTYRAGDYWMIPARVATGDVEWPGPPDQPEFQLPHGPAHYYAPLAIREPSRQGGGAGVRDLRCCIARIPCVKAETATATANTNAAVKQDVDSITVAEADNVATAGKGKVADKPK
jgi:hypothetical protein